MGDVSKYATSYCLLLTCHQSLFSTSLVDTGHVLMKRLDNTKPYIDDHLSQPAKFMA
jgi:hypothetical protein